MNWETVNPLWWVPRGYAAVRVDTRGSGKSPGQTDPFSLQEAIDFYDSIEWAARQPWCSGNVATMGISYFAMTQWLVAIFKPPSLKAIVPWEGAADMYRDLAYHGGIFCFGFVADWYNNHMAHHLLARRETRAPTPSRRTGSGTTCGTVSRATITAADKHVWEEIDIPLYTVGNWSGMGLHLRGNTEAFMRARSKEKKLRIHAGTHYHPFYAEEARTDQLRFLDHWLKGKDTGIMDEPPVKLLIRTGGGKGYAWRQENEWPSRGRSGRAFILSPVSKGSRRERWKARSSRPRREVGRDEYFGERHDESGVASASWTSTVLAGSLPRLGVSFETEPLREEVEITGPVVLDLWVSSTNGRHGRFRDDPQYRPNGQNVGNRHSSSNPCPSQRAGCGRRIASSIQR